TRPLMEMGLDSLELMELRVLLGRHLDTDIEPTFFFRYSTPEAMVHYFREQMSSVEPAMSEPETDPLSMTSEPMPETSRATKTDGDDAIAIIGLACRFPGGVTDPAEFWTLLRNGIDAITEMPANRRDTYRASGLSSEPDRMYGGFVDGVDHFDAAFFHIPPREAEVMDPQQRLLLEESWHALEQAGIDPTSLRESQTGVFVGIFSHDYELLQLKQQQPVEAYFGSGNSNSVAAGRIAYALGLQGPAMAVNTACSSSLVAVHLAAQNLQNGECDLALAAGVNLILSPELSQTFAQAGMLAADGRCKTFDASANGYVRSEGCGVIVLKRLSEAVADRDNILAVIRGSAVNQDGASNGLTAPNGLAQEALLRKALQTAMIEPHEVSYVEAHGTGTVLGDPIEIKALGNVYGAGRTADNPLTVGSVKTNIGHTEAAAGIAGLVKVVLSLQHGQIPPHLHFEKPNPYISWDAFPLVVPTDITPWPSPTGGRRLAGVSSFGFSGTNAHLVIEDYQEAGVRGQASGAGPHLIVLSAKNEARLGTYVGKMQAFLEANADVSLAEMAYTLQVGRAAMDARLALVVDDIATLREKLTAYLAGETDILHCYQGQVKQDSGNFNLLNDGEDSRVLVRHWLTKVKLEKLAVGWVRGAVIDWSLLYGVDKPYRVSLPTYPFAKERYWLPVNGRLTVDNGQLSIDRLHPLVHKNTSTLTEQRFSTTFTGAEFFLRDHQVRGEKVLPGVAYLEMVRAAGEIAVEHETIFQIKDVIWIRPMVVAESAFSNESHQVLLGLYPEEKGEIAFEVSSNGLVYSQGKLVIGRAQPPEPLDIPAIEARCRSTIEGAACYPRFKERGLEYGPALQGLDQISHGQQEALARLRLPAAADQTGYGLHPSVLDAALQAMMGLAISQDEQVKQGLFLPFAVETVTIYDASPKQAYAYAMWSAGVDSAGDVAKFDITLTNEQGAVWVTLKGVTVRIAGRDGRKIRAYLGSSERDRAIEIDQTVALTAAQDGPLFDATQSYLKARLSENLKLPATRIEPNAPWEKYGLDSIMMLALIRQLEQHFDNLSKTLFFEYESLADLTAYFVEAYPALLQNILGLESGQTEATPPVPDQTRADSVPNSSRQRWLQHTGERAAALNNSKDIAIVGLSGRYPQAETLTEFWQNLKTGRDCISEIPAERWDRRRYDKANQHKPGQSTSKWGGFMADVDKFDPLFFNISPREAELTDPQERLFLEIAWQTLEDAGYTRQTLAKQWQGQVGVFVGVMWGEYQLYGHEQLSLSSTYASIANRVSYYLNLNGPSLAVDTMCSSSLTAIHLACESLKRGECTAALVGGVNVTIHPNKYRRLAQGNFAASDGRCRSFGAGGDGYVPGEGVGAVLLKPLAQAEADGDHIYGIIKGSSVNHGGKSNGYTVPNPVAQGRLVADTLRKSGVPAESISYVEAHGTGTALGDPIEIRGLSQAWGDDLPIGYSCAIGSVKSNIGHLESAAGIAGLTKVLLQMKHQQLAPSLHSEKLNPHIDFGAAPFEVQQALAEWKRPVVEVDGLPQEYPRRAGISSYGAGGTNAHLVVEEYQGSGVRDQELGKGPHLIVLSAKNEERLSMYVQRLLTHLAANSDVALAKLAYTLQVGREAMETRLALVVSTVEALVERLRQYAQQQPSIAGLYQGQTNIDAFKSELMAGKAGEAFIKISMNERDLDRLAQLWVAGVEIEWDLLYSDRKPGRISLPTYPFAKERYWVPSNGQFSILHSPFSIDILHPLLHRNISDLEVQRFSTTFTGAEFFLTDHQVQGQKMLPGAAYLEMARAAGALAVKKGVITQIKDVVWVRPLMVSADLLDMQLSLHPTEHGEVSYEVDSVGEAGQPVVHSQGRLVFGTPVEEAQFIDLVALRQRCREIQSGADCYRQFEQQGLEYGPAFQVIEGVIRNETEALIRLRLPAEVDDEAYGWHPSLMDGLLQSVIGLSHSDTEAKAGLVLPFALEKLECLRPAPTTGYAYVTRSTAKPDTAFNIALLDDAGRVCLKLHNLSLKAVTPLASGWYYRPYWEQQALPDAPSTTAQGGGDVVLVVAKELQTLSAALADRYPQQRVVCLFLSDQTVQLSETDWEIDLTDETGVSASLGSLATIDTLYFLGGLSGQQFDLADLGGLNRGQEQGILSLFRLVKLLEQHGLMTHLSALKVLTNQTQPLHPQQPIQPWSAALSGLTRSLAKEYPLVEVSCLDVALTTDDAGQVTLDGTDVTAIVAERGSRGQPVGLRQGVRYVRRLAPLNLPTAQDRPYRQGGVYLILGGAGGIGLETAAHLAGQVQAKVVLVGRSALTPEKEVQFKRIEAAGGDYLYCQADGTDLAQIQAVVRQAKETFGPINGVIHSALVLRDGVISRMDEASLQAVLAPKVAGSLVLAEAVKDEPLDFMLFFSSSQSFWGNAGQSNYAAGSTFIDTFALYLDQVKPYPVKVINWGYWGSVGVVATDAYRQRLAEQGIHSIAVAEGLAALDQIVAGPLTQVAAIKADRSILAQLGVAFERRVEQAENSYKPGKEPALAPIEVPANGDLKAATTVYLAHIFAATLKLERDRLKRDQTFEQYGIDSVMSLEIVNRLRQDFGRALPATLLFEYMTLEKLAGYFLSHHSDTVATLIRAVQSQPRDVNVLRQPVNVAQLFGRSPRFQSKPETAGSKPAAQTDDIAIIGLSGRYPLAETLDDFWQNLQAGRDCIREIPPERWDVRRYFNPDPDNVGTSYSKWGGFIDTVDKFDPLFFNISPREAERMDPQERLFLETVWATVEDAGYSRAALAQVRQVGVFVGVMNAGYSQLEKSAAISAPVTYWSIANRVSYLFDWYGPSLAVDTACSSSLTAVHLACESLKRGECQVAVAGGVNLIIHPSRYIDLSSIRMLSAGDKVKAFGAGADGFVNGEGVGAILLKPLEQAKADGDQIYGIIKGSAINAGGKTSGYTVPNPNAQAELIASALVMSGVEASTISYVEAHGTGTALGDPIEIRGLNRAWGEHYPNGYTCAIGSVKSNIGHLESAAGIAGLTKVLLQMKHRRLVPSLHAETLNAHIDFEATPFRVQRELTDWRRPVLETEGVRTEYPRRAGISSFGAGGANAHLLVEEYRGQESGDRSQESRSGLQVIVLSARNEERLRVYAGKLLTFLEQASAPHQVEQERDDEAHPLTIQSALRAMVAEIMGVTPDDIEVEQPLEEYDLDPVQLSHLKMMVEERYQCKLPLTLFSGQTSVTQVTHHLTSLEAASKRHHQVTSPPTLSIIDLAYTLQVGREAMDSRLAFVAHTLADIRHKLSDYLENKTDRFYQGQLTPNHERLNLLTEGVEAKAFVEMLIKSGGLEKLAQLWTAGVEPDWSLLYSQEKPRRISLPTYPFARKRYWPDGSQHHQETPRPKNQATEQIEMVTPNPDPLHPSKLVLTAPHAAVAAEQPAQSGPVRLSTPNDADDHVTTAPNVTPAQGSTATTVDPAAIEQQLRRQLVEQLYLEPDEVEAHKKFVDLGLDSITGVEWSKRINAEFGLNLSATILYDYPTLRRLANYLAEILPSPTVKAQTSEPNADTAVNRQAARIDALENRTPIHLKQFDIPHKREPKGYIEDIEDYGLVVSGMQEVRDTRLTVWPVPAPYDDEVQIQVKASAINFPDVLCLKGLYPTLPRYPFVPGFEVAGVVTAVGGAVNHIAMGDTVIAVTGPQLGGHARSVNVPAVGVVKKPDRLSFEAACSLPVAFLTVYHALQLANLKAGEHILIQTAAGGCGLMAVQLANLRRAVIYGTSSRETKLSFLEQIGVDFRLNYTGNFDEQIRAITDNRGVDVVLNMLGGAAIQKGLNILAPGGRYLELAIHGLKASGQLDLSGLVHNQAFYSIDGRRQSGFGNADRLIDYLSRMVKMVEDEAIYPVVHRIYPLSQIQDALRYVESGGHLGKVVISHTQEEIVDLTETCLRDLVEQRERSWHRAAEQQPVAQKRGVDRKPATDDIAIIGMAGRFPGANDVDELWQNIIAGVDSIAEVTPDRWDSERYYDPDRHTPGKSYNKWLGALADIDRFDPLFFNISPREAERMDPQQRLFLEEAWKALEDAGYAGQTLSDRKCGVFVGTGAGDYYAWLNQHHTEADAHTLLGNSPSILAARLAYILNLKGASLAIDTACSSSLVAIHEGCQSLLTGQNEMVLAGGVCVLTGPQMHIMTSKAQMLAGDGRCKTFDNRADGFGLAEGVGVVVLKRLADAVRDGDQIYGVLRGSGLNQDGATNGITAPSVTSQTALALEVYRRSGIDPAGISLVEAHGTGTKLGDPIEIEALTAAFRMYTKAKSYCAIGSVKSNIGHTLTAAGVAGVIKVLLALKHKKLPPSLHFEQPNEHIDFENSPFYVNTALQDWKVKTGLRRAAVSSFGFSGTNAHLVIEEFQESGVRNQELGRGPHLIVLSAKNEERLRVCARTMADYLKANSDVSLADMAYTLQVGRAAMEERLALVVSGFDELIEQLSRYEQRQPAVKPIYCRHSQATEFEADFLFGGQAGEAFIKIALSNQDLVRLAQLWVAGVNIDWNLLYPDHKPNRISLPTYPFERQRYWLDSPQSGRNRETSSSRKCSKVTPPENEQRLEPWRTWLYEITWQPRALFGLPADYLPEPEHLRQMVTAEISRLLAERDLGAYKAAVAELESVSIDYVLAVLTQAGFVFQREHRWDTEQIARQLGVIPRYHRFLKRLLGMLVEIGVLQSKDDHWRVLRVPNGRDPQQRVETLKKQWGSLAEAELTLLERCGSRLGEVLQGGQAPLELLFPQRNADTVTEFYQSSPVAKVMNHLVQQTIMTALASLPIERGIRILEVGAGTGGTTAYLLSHLPADQIEYSFTDVSPLFTQKAQAKFAEYDFVRYETLDIEHSPLEQGFELHQYDIILAANVLHATTDLRQSLGHIRQILAPGGLLILLETTERSRWVDLTFGLTDGWWRFSDTRRDHPLLTADQWQALLLDCGFSTVTPVSDETTTTAELGHTLMIAQATEVSATSNESWLLLADETGVAETLAASLRAQGKHVTLIFPGETFAQLDEYTFYINPEAKSHYRQVLESRRPIDKIVHLWSLDTAPVEALTIPSLQLASRRGCGSTLLLVQALLKDGREATPKLWLVTRGAVACNQAGGSSSNAPNRDMPGVAQSPLWGMGKVIALEHPNLWGGMVDLAPANDLDEQAGEVTLLAAAIQNGANEDFIAVRDGRPYSARLLPSSELGPEACPIREEGTYLISGGLGYLGLNFAQQLVEHGAGHVVLLGRSNPSAEALTIIETLNQTGQVLVLQADVSSQEDMKRVFEACRAKPPLRGIIHAAGITGNLAELQTLEIDDLDSVFQAKTVGAWLLHTMTKSLDLDFFVMCSSAGAVWGAKGQAFYAAANCFMDILAHHRRAIGLPALSINWGMLAGKRATTGEFWQRLVQLGMGEMPAGQGFQAMIHLAGDNISQAAVASMDWAKFRRIYEARSSHPLLAEIGEQAEAVPSLVQPSTILQRLSETAVSERANLLITYLQREVAKTLQFPQLPQLRQGFFDMGMDSLLAVDLTHHLNQELGISLQPAVVFDFPTIQELAEYLVKVLFPVEPPANVSVAELQDQPPALSEFEPEPGADLARLSRIKELSDNELEALIDEKLARLGD
ncbi:MAG: SDR family NAD(P)-dependent oxidoreductase, partial [Anaerolineae bacterium]|nr:SDR family NAD(P)-dependent oxidoreductase [Anaerolineae bacterium]